MKILAIAASPRRGGNSETLLDNALSGIKGSDVKKVILSDLNIAPCGGCNACFKTGKCVIKDDMRALYDDLLKTDVLLVASPVYFKGLPCQLKCAIDRCNALWARKYVLKKGIVAKERRTRKRGSAILVCASSGVKDMFTGAIITMKAWFKTLGFEYKKEFLAQGMEEKKAASKDKKLLKKIVEFGNRLV